MAVSTHFQTEITAVDATKTLDFVVNTSTYTEFEWSYAGLTITGGSELACEYGAAELLERMGFRWYSPNTEFYVRPASIPTNLTAAKQSTWMPNNNVFLTYGHSWDNIYLADRSTLNTALSKWQTLNGVRTSVWPAGHRWVNIINANQPYFQANPTYYLGTLGSGSVKFNLSLTGADYNNIVELAASEILKQGLNAWNRTNMDATDGDSQSTDLFWPFTKAVAAKVRSGTNAIGTHPARTGTAAAQLGAYAYAGHRQPPTLAYTPGVYTQVALGFTPPDTWIDLVEGHGAKSDAILLREYWAVNQPLPFVDMRHKNAYFLRYDALHAAADTIGFTAECSAYWLNNLVMFRWGIQKARTGTTTYATALDDVMADVFDDDAAVRSLYEFWGDPYLGDSLWALRRTFDIIDDMADAWYKTYFKYIAVILAKLRYLPPQTALASQTPSDPFPAAFSSMCSNVVAIRLLDIFHSYGFLRQKANGAIQTNYPQLRMFANPLPDWWTNPELPTSTEFTSYHAQLLVDTPHDDELDSTDLVLVHGITPRIAATTSATKFNIVGTAKFKFIGPGTVTETPNDTTHPSITTTYGSGINSVQKNFPSTYTHSGGYLFLDTFPSARKEPDGTGFNHWFYVPARNSGEFVAEADSRVRFVDQNGQLNLLPETDAGYVDPANLGPGQVAVNNANTRGNFHNMNGNRYMSMHATIALLPRVIAEEEFTNYARVVVSASVPGDPTEEEGDPTPEPELPVNLVAPVISGVGREGETLTVTSTGTWDQEVDAFTYSWRSNGQAIEFTDDANFLITSEYVDTPIDCVVGGYVAILHNGLIGYGTSNVINAEDSKSSRGGFDDEVIFPPPIDQELIDKAREARRLAEQELRQALYALYHGDKPQANEAIFTALQQAEAAETALEQTDHASLLAHVRHLHGDIETALNAVTLQITKVRHAILVAKEIEERMAEEEAVVSMLLH
jgi:hypothetical protein